MTIEKLNIIVEETFFAHNYILRFYTVAMKAFVDNNDNALLKEFVKLVESTNPATTLVDSLKQIEIIEYLNQLIEDGELKIAILTISAPVDIINITINDKLINETFIEFKEKDIVKINVAKEINGQNAGIQEVKKYTLTDTETNVEIVEKKGGETYNLTMPPNQVNLMVVSDFVEYSMTKINSSPDVEIRIMGGFGVSGEKVITNEPTIIKFEGGGYVQFKCPETSFIKSILLNSVPHSFPLNSSEFVLSDLGKNIGNIVLEVTTELKPIVKYSITSTVDVPANVAEMAITANGKITPLVSATPMPFEVGTVGFLNIKTKPTHWLKTVTIDGASQSITDNSVFGKSITMNADVAVVTTTELIPKQKVNITVDVPANTSELSFTPEGGSKVNIISGVDSLFNKNTKGSMTIKTKPTHRLKSVTVGGIVQPLTPSDVNFTKVFTLSDDSIVTVVTELIPVPKHTLTATVNTSNHTSEFTFTPSGGSKVNLTSGTAYEHDKGTVGIFNVKTKPTNRIKSITIDGKDETVANVMDFSKNITLSANMVIVVTTEEIPVVIQRLAVSVDVESNLSEISFTPDGGSKVMIKDKVPYENVKNTVGTLVIKTVSESFDLKSIEVNGVSETLTDTDTYTKKITMEFDTIVNVTTESDPVEEV